MDVTTVVTDVTHPLLSDPAVPRALCYVPSAGVGPRNAPDASLNSPGQLLRYSGTITPICDMHPKAGQSASERPFTDSSRPHCSCVHSAELLQGMLRGVGSGGGSGDGDGR